MSFLSIDGTIVIQLINFAIFFVVLNVVFLRPVGAAIRKRREYINSLVSDYDRYQAEAKSLREEAEKARAAARREAEHAIAQARAQTSNETAEAIEPIRGASTGNRRGGDENRSGGNRSGARAVSNASFAKSPTS